MRINEILKKANEVQRVLHIKSKPAKKEGDIQISLVIIKDEYFNKRKINIRKEVYKEAPFDRNVLLSDCNLSEFFSLEYKNPIELEMILLGVERKYDVDGFHVVTEE